MWSGCRPTCEDVLEGKFYVAGVKGGSFDEREIVLACWIISAPRGLLVLQLGKLNILANCLASSVGTARRCRKSLLLPTNMMTMLESA